MRSPGTGTVEPLPSGKFRGVLPGRGGKKLPARPTREEAESDLAIALHLIAEQGLRPLPQGTPLHSFGRRTLDGRALAGYTNAQRELSRWATHVEQGALTNATVESLTRGEVVTWVRSLSTARAKQGNGHATKRPRTLARSVVVDALRILRAVIKEAILLGLRADDPTLGVEVPRDRGRTHDPWTYLRPQEVVRLLEVGRTATTSLDLGGQGERGPREVRLVHPEDLDAAIVALYTGMREGELWTLHLRDVDLEAGRLTVRYGGRGKGGLTPTKGRRPRVLMLLPPAYQALARQLTRLRATTPPSADPQLIRCRRCGRSKRAHEERRASACTDYRASRHGTRRSNPHGLVFPSLSRGVAGYRALRAPSCWEAWLEAAGLTGRDRPHEATVTWHTLRHTFATLALAGALPGVEGEGWRLEKVSAYLGHRSIAITQRYADVAALL